MPIYDADYLDLQIFAFFDDLKKLNWQTETSYLLRDLMDECLMPALEFTHEDLESVSQVPDDFMQDFYKIENNRFTFEPDESVVAFFKEFFSRVAGFDFNDDQISHEGTLELAILKSNLAAVIISASKMSSLEVLSDTMRFCRDYMIPYECLHDPMDAPYNENGVFLCEIPYKDYEI